MAVKSFEANNKDRVNNWGFFSPRSAVAPIYKMTMGGEDPILTLSSTGDARIFGGFQASLSLIPGTWYKAQVSAKISELKDANLSLIAVVAGHFLKISEDYDDILTLSQVFYFSGDEEIIKDKFLLVLRSTDKGSVQWFNPSVVQTETPAKRIARIVTTRFGEWDPIVPKTLLNQRKRIKTLLQQGGLLSPDLLLITEFASSEGMRDENWNFEDEAEEIPKGPCCQLFSKYAKKHNMYVVGGLLERRGGFLINTAVIFDRQGNFVGQYDKTHLTFGELYKGISPGSDYPIFDLDFGRVAIHICYDEWFPEVSRYYALKGAELLLLPVVGGKPITWRTRALDNGIYFVTASSRPPSMIIDSSGVILAENNYSGIACADIDLNYRQVNWYKDPTVVFGMPTTNPEMQNTLDNGLLEGLASLYEGQEEERK